MTQPSHKDLREALDTIAHEVAEIADTEDHAKAVGAMGVIRKALALLPTQGVSGAAPKGAGSGEPAEPEEGDKCREDGCGGEYGFRRVENCSCHISPPCHGCVENPLVCLRCGEYPPDAPTARPAPAEAVQPFARIAEIEGVVQRMRAWLRRDPGAPKIQIGECDVALKSLRGLRSEILEAMAQPEWLHRTITDALSAADALKAPTARPAPAEGLPVAEQAIKDHGPYQQVFRDPAPPSQGAEAIDPYKREGCRVPAKWVETYAAEAMWGPVIQALARDLMDMTVAYGGAMAKVETLEAALMQRNAIDRAKAAAERAPEAPDLGLKVKTGDDVGVAIDLAICEMNSAPSAPLRDAKRVEEPGPADGWWCPTCKKSIPGGHVTYQETHDEREGGCGGSVQVGAEAPPAPPAAPPAGVGAPGTHIPCDRCKQLITSYQNHWCPYEPKEGSPDLEADVDDEEESADQHMQWASDGDDLEASFNSLHAYAKKLEARLATPPAGPAVDLEQEAKPADVRALVDLCMEYAACRSAANWDKVQEKKAEIVVTLRVLRRLALRSPGGSAHG